MPRFAMDYNSHTPVTPTSDYEKLETEINDLHKFLNDLNCTHGTLLERVQNLLRANQ